MSEVAKIGRELFDKGYSCSEACWLALNGDLPQEWRDFGLQLSGGFGGGFATGKVCGAITGIVLSLGRKYGRKLGEDRSEELKEKVLMLMEYADRLYGSSQCNEIRPFEDYRPFCSKLVEDMLVYGEKLLQE